MKTAKERALLVKESGSSAIDCAGLTDAEVDAKMLDWMAEHFAAHEADVVEAIATWISADEEAFGHAFGCEDPRSYLTLSAAKEFAAAIRSGAWRKAGR